MSPAARRVRQQEEIVLLWVAGEHRRAAALAAEHLEEFVDDAVARAVVDRWFGD
jgi:hypothetical protein